MTRWYWALVPVAALTSTLGSSSCIQIGPSADADAGTDASDDAASSTVEAQCKKIWTVYCGRAHDCYGQDTSSCVDTTVSSCCGRYCALTATSSEKVIAKCVGDIQAESCDSIDVNELPATCENVVTH
jgi:hypothetical protein